MKIQIYGNRRGSSIFSVSKKRYIIRGIDGDSRGRGIIVIKFTRTAIGIWKSVSDVDTSLFYCVERETTGV